eukprot:gb/GEZN01007352.1/.p1 GENE.gb/GEZN01007352.1/~~gb/GEZN01007352.1/.p1  ORF type:complete len:507 (+),score=39.68 gb/GEZN01007352.1/:47-1522(+)
MGTVRYGKVDESFVSSLQACLGKNYVFSLFATDTISQKNLEKASIDKTLIHKAHRPEVVVLPADTKQVAEVVKLCNKNKIPFLARGAGTGLEGGAIPIHGGVVIDMQRLISLTVFPEEKLAIVGAGMRKLDLQNNLKPYGLIFGPDPSSNPCLGGMASTGGSGMTTMMYGTTKENIVSLTVVTPDGQIIDETRRSRVRKSSTGYELTQLYLGAEGTLGIITSLALRLFPILSLRVGALCEFDKIREAVKTVVAIKNASLHTMLRCELMNAECVAATNLYSKTTLSVKPTLLFEFNGNDLQWLQRDLQTATDFASRFGSTKVVKAEKGEELDLLWAARRDCYWAAWKYRGLQTNGKESTDSVLTTDICVPLPHLEEIITFTEAKAAELGILCCICAHISDGNFHGILPYKGSNTAEKERVVQLEHYMIDKALELEGTVSGEHGVGLGKMDLIHKEHGEVHIGVQRAIKKALDPHSLMNPGKVVYGRPPPAKL